MLQLLLHNPPNNIAPPTLMAFAETWFTDAMNIPSISQYHWSCLHSPPNPNTNRQSPRGGLALLYHNKLLAVHRIDSISKHFDLAPPGCPIPANHTNTAAILWHIIKIPNLPTFLLAITYIPPQNNNNSYCIDECLKSINSAKSQYPNVPIIIVGDFNLHHSDWDCKDIDLPSSAAIHLANYINDHEMHILNNIYIPDEYTRYKNNNNNSNNININDDSNDDNNGSIIDLVLSTSPNLISNLSFNLEPFISSDHRPITITLEQPSINSNIYEPPHMAWDIHHSLDWETSLPPALSTAYNCIKHQFNCLSNLPHTHSQAQNTIDKTYELFISTLDNTLRQLIGKTEIKHVDKPWFDKPHIKRMYNHMTRVKSLAIKHGMPHMHDHAKSLRRQLQRLVRKEKEKSWGNLVRSLDSNPRSQWKLLKRVTPSSYSPLRSISHPTTKELPTSHQDSLNNLAYAFSLAAEPPPSTIPSYHEQILDRYQHRVQQESQFILASHESDNWTFTASEVKEQLTKQHTNTAPGPDTILPIFLKFSGDHCYYLLSKIYQYSWDHAVLPTQWKEANVMALYKNTGSRSESSSYRPISMTSILIRSFEHLIHKKLVSFLSTRSFFHNLQFGFRSNKSTLDAINYLLSTVKLCCRTESFKDQRHPPVPVVFLDIKKAFDRVWIPLLLLRIEEAGIRGKAFLWINSFLTNRRIRIIDKSLSSVWVPIQYGVPQGCVLSPLLFLIFINSISIKLSLECPLVSPLLYADDKALVPNINRMPYRYQPYLSQLQKALDLLTRWCRESRMAFGFEKTNTIIFCAKQQLDPTTINRIKALRLTNFNITVKDSYIYLGLHLHWRLIWGKQHKLMIKRARQDSYKLTRIATTSKKPHFPAIRTLCVGYLKPRCTYGFQFWSQLLNQKQLREFNSAFIQPVRRCLSLPPTTHQLGLFVESNTPSFTAVRTHSNLSWLYRTKRLPTDHPTHKIYDIENATDRLRKHLIKPIRYAPISAIAVTDTLPDLKERIIPFIALQDPSNSLINIFNSPDFDITQLTKPQLDSLQMWCTHYEWRTGKYVGMAINEDSQDNDNINTKRSIQKRKKRKKNHGNSNRNNNNNNNDNDNNNDDHYNDNDNVNNNLNNNNNNNKNHTTTAPLLQCKPFPFKSHYLYSTDDKSIRLRARLRMNRAYTQSHRARFYNNNNTQPIAPYCTHPPCLNSQLEESPEHILLHCPRYQTLRQKLTDDLKSQANYQQSLSLPLITGSVAVFGNNRKQFEIIITLTSKLLHSINIERKKIRNLLPLDHG